MEREAKAQEREKRKGIRYAKVLATLQGSPMANPESLKDKARGKCLICRQVGHWAKECPNRDKSPRTSLLEWLATNTINWDIGRHSALGTQEPQGEAPSLPSRWFNSTEAAHCSQPTCHRQPSQCWSQRCNWMGQVGLRISWLTQGLLTLPDLLLWSLLLPNLYHFGCYRKNNY